jgi:hypothetical protein
MGVPADGAPSEQVTELLRSALEELQALAAPRGLFEDVARETFERLYAGHGERPTPLAVVFPKAELLTLFVVTLGEELSSRVRLLFDEGELALGAMLDAAASETTERAAVYLERAVERRALCDGLARPGARALRYSPGYCGWDITGPRALFDALGPGEIGVRLLESCLMEPLKTISGVIVTGPREIHEFGHTFSCCSECSTRECRDRVRSLTRPDAHES